MQPERDADVLTIREVARVLRIGRNSAYEAAQRGELPVLRIGRRLLVPRVALERLLSGDVSAVRASPLPHAVPLNAVARVRRCRG
jgi:excisionase family DNA binding protein